MKMSRFKLGETVYLQATGKIIASEEVVNDIRHRLVDEKGKTIATFIDEKYLIETEQGGA